MTAKERASNEGVTGNRKRIEGKMKEDRREEMR
jgi:hypothetical protein